MNRTQSILTGSPDGQGRRPRRWVALLVGTGGGVVGPKIPAPRATCLKSSVRSRMIVRKEVVVMLGTTRLAVAAAAAAAMFGAGALVAGPASAATVIVRGDTMDSTRTVVADDWWRFHHRGSIGPSVGFDTGVENGGFDDLMTSKAWSFPAKVEPGNWDAMVKDAPDVARVARGRVHVGRVLQGARSRAIPQVPRPDGMAPRVHVGREVVEHERRARVAVVLIGHASRR